MPVHKDHTFHRHNSHTESAPLLLDSFDVKDICACDNTVASTLRRMLTQCHWLPAARCRSSCIHSHRTCQADAAVALRCGFMTYPGDLCDASHDQHLTGRRHSRLDVSNHLCKQSLGLRPWNQPGRALRLSSTDMVETIPDVTVRRRYNLPSATCRKPG